MATQRKPRPRAPKPGTNVNELRKKYRQTELHIQALVQEEQALINRTNEVRSAHGQMMGRLRAFAELLGDVPPLEAVQQIPPPGENGTEPDQAEG